jgi:hypothetical protein
MSDDRRTDHPTEVVVVPGSKKVRAKPPVVRTPATAHGHGAAGSESIDVGSEGFRSSKVTGDNPRKPFQGRPTRHKDDVLQVCRILRTALNDQGGTWGSFSEPVPPAKHADATAADSAGSVLRVQVSRVERASLKTMARGDPIIRRRSVGQRVTDIRVAVDSGARRHPTAERSESLLALDAIRSPEHVERTVVDAFLRAHQTYVAGLGYGAIWLVGPTGEMSYRIG